MHSCLGKAALCVCFPQEVYMCCIKLITYLFNEYKRRALDEPYCSMKHNCTCVARVDHFCNVAFKQQAKIETNIFEQHIHVAVFSLRSVHVLVRDRFL